MPRYVVKSGKQVWHCTKQTAQEAAIEALGEWPKDELLGLIIAVYGGEEPHYFWTESLLDWISRPQPSQN